MPQAPKHKATICVEKSKMVIGLPFQICTSRAGKVICKKGTLAQRLSQMGVRAPAVGEVLSEFTDELGDFVDQTELGRFSVEIPFALFMSEEKRREAAGRLKKMLEKNSYEVEIYHLSKASIGLRHVS